MQERRRVYRKPREPKRGLLYLLMFLSAVILLSGLVNRDGSVSVSLEVAPTATPIPTDEAFDETPESREWTMPAIEWYALQLGTFDNADAAQELAAQYRPRGAAGYVWVDSRYRTLAALYPSKDDAKGVRDKLWESHGIDAYPYAILLPEVTLRMQGMKGQLDILQAAFVQAEALAEALQTLSISMDRQELNSAEALSELRALAQNAELLRLRLTQRFVQPRHQIVDGLIALFDGYVNACVQLHDESNTVELATETKYRAIETLDRLRQIYDGMNNT